MSAVGNYEVINSSVTVAENSSASIACPTGKVALSIYLHEVGSKFYPTIDPDGSGRINGTTALSTTHNVGYTLVVAEMGLCPVSE